MGPTQGGGTQDTDFNKGFTKGFFTKHIQRRNTSKNNEKHKKTLRSNFNSRGVNSRELFWFFGHSSLSHHAILTKIGGNESYRPPGAF